MGTPKPAPFNVFLDSDGPVANFLKAMTAAGAEPDDFKHRPGVYLWLEVTPGAQHAIDQLKVLDELGKLRVWVLTKTPSKSPYAYTEKVLWYRQNFEWLEDRVILTHDKHLLGTEDDFLLDDRPHKANAHLFRGEFVFFDEHRPEESWDKLLKAVYHRL